MYKSFTFICTHCDKEFDDLIEVEQGGCVTQATTECPTCSKKVHNVFAAPGLDTFSLMDADARKEAMLKRSENHTKKKLM